MVQTKKFLVKRMHMGTSKMINMVTISDIFPLHFINVFMFEFDNSFETCKNA